MSLIDNLTDKTIPGLEKALDLHLKRTEAIASNIANAETPQYRAVELDFASELERAFKGENTSSLKTTNSKHMNTADAGMSHYIADLSGQTKPDGNNVDIDLQMGRLSSTTGKYEMAADLLKKKFKIIKAAIRSGI